MACPRLDVTLSGWMIFNQLSVLRTAAVRRGARAGLACGAPDSGGARTLRLLERAVTFEAIGAKDLLALLSGGEAACALATPALHLSVAYALLQHTAPEQLQVPGAPVSPKEEALQLLSFGDSELRGALEPPEEVGNEVKPCG